MVYPISLRHVMVVVARISGVGMDAGFQGHGV